MIKVLITGYEAAPFYKRGGLGDVMGSLPKALEKLDVEVRVVVPYYQDIDDKYNVPKVGEFSVVFGSKLEKISVHEKRFPNSKVIIYFLGNKKYLRHVNIRGKNKKIDQFVFFDKAVVEFFYFLLEKKKWLPSIIHCNDWHTALIPLIVRGEIPTLLTIHNLNYQGVGSRRILDLLHIKDEETKEIKRGRPANEINILGEGILHAARVSTVSPTYAKEIMIDYEHDPIYSFLQRREKEGLADGQILGILNGIDYDVWNTESDHLIDHTYEADKWKVGKAENKSALLKSLSLQDRPTFCFVGRMAKQKGIDLLTKSVEQIMALDVNIIFLGAGEPNIEKSVTRLAQKYASNIRAELAYSEQFAHQLYAGADFILIPSHYEPCGLIQMVAMHYGTIPIAAKTGGLKDSIDDNINGFLFEKGKAESLVLTIKKALKIYQDQDKYEKMVNMAIRTDFTWDKSAFLYKKLYQEMLSTATLPSYHTPFLSIEYL